MRGRGVQAEVLVSLAVVMVTATGLLAAFFFETHARQSERLGPLLGRGLAAQARDLTLAYEARAAGATWFVVSAGGVVRTATRVPATLDEVSRELATAAREQNRALLRSGAPWQPIRFAAPLAGRASGEVAVAVLAPAVPAAAVLALLAADSLIFTLLGAYLLRRRVVMPLHRLAEAARSIGEGGPGARVVVEGVGEAAQVGHAFNEMSEALERRSHALEKAVADLRTANTSLRRAQDGLARAERLAAVGHLAAGVAHEVGNPMGALLAFLELAGREGSLSDTARSHLDRAVQQGERVRGILRQLLDFSRPPRASRAPVNLAALVEQSVGLVTAQRCYSGIHFEVEAEGDIAMAIADEGLVGQILLNLLLNAADAVAEEPSARIRITLRRASLARRAGDPDLGVGTSRRREPDAVECRIEDDGPGIPDEDRSRIFDPFYTTKPPGEGTGLGLANAQRLVEELEGILECTDPELLGGAAFSLRLPAALARTGPAVRAEARQRRGA